eukprot:3755092-Rhodomonas_salina.1
MTLARDTRAIQHTHTHARCHSQQGGRSTQQGGRNAQQEVATYNKGVAKRTTRGRNEQMGVAKCTARGRNRQESEGSDRS